MSRVNVKIETTYNKQLEHKALLKQLGINNISTSKTKDERFIHFQIKDKSEISKIFTHLRENGITIVEQN